MGAICNVTVRFIVDIPDVDIEKRLGKLCNNFGCEAIERCFNCRKPLDTCIVYDNSYGLRFWFNGSTRFVNFYNFATSCNIIDYELECDDLFFHRVDSSQMIRDKMLLAKLAIRVSELLGFTEFTLIPTVLINSWK